MTFAKKNLTHAQFFLAERVFSTLNSEGKNGNLLEIEKALSSFADKIIIVLESPSSFTELGVFSYGALRKKIIVINDSQFRNSESFVTKGPLEAIEDAADSRSIIHYKMNEDGLDRLDSIGDVYAPLLGILEEPKRTRSLALDTRECNPGKNFGKKSAMMIHDLVYFSGPIKHAELVEVLKLVFGNQSFNYAKELLAILVAIDSLALDNRLYRSKLHKPYYKYRFDTNKLVSIYRNYMQKCFPERLYGH